MRNKFLKGIVLFLVFIAGVILFSSLSLLNRQQTVSASDLTDPTLPVVCIDISGNKVNRMFGYTEEMDARNMRDVLIPMSTRRSVTISYKAYRNTVRSVSYEVTAPDTGTVVENAKIGNFRTDGDYMTAEFSLSEPILMNREYPIRFTIQTDTRDIYYYGRVIQRSDPVADLYVQFVYDFYEGCLNPNGASDLNTYLETDDTITNNSFTSVNIKSSLRQVTWGSLHPQIYRKAIPTIKDINGETCSITADYLISADGDHGQEIYHVSEFYRLRYYNSRMMLLNFNRTALQVFDGSTPQTVSASGLNVGVAERTIQYMTNETSDTVAFVQNGALWEYSSGSDKIARVFSLSGTGENTDERWDNDYYDIKIIRVSEGGGLDFAVYGYMSRGEHEGRSGVSFCHYNSESSAVTERAFVAYDRSFEQLEKDLDHLCYVNNDGVAWVYLNRSVCRVDLNSGRSEIILSDIHPDCFVSSESHAQIAWMNEMDPNASVTLTVMDLDSETRRSIRSADGSYLRTIGFLNADLVYGIARSEDIAVSRSGRVTFAMKELKIEDLGGTLIKDYNPADTWVTDVNMEPGLAQLTCVRKEGGAYVAAPNDNIINNKQSDETEVTVSLSNSSRQGVLVSLKFPRTITHLNPTFSESRLRYLASEPVTVPAEAEGFPLYYVYALGSLQSVYTDPAEAILKADENVGIVINEDGQYIYERGNKELKTELANSDIPDIFLTGEINAETLQAGVDESTRVMDLSGCTLDQVLYQLSQGRSVVTILADGSVAVIVGYDRYNTLQLNFETGEHFYMGINDSTNSMLEGGNIFVSYIESRATVKEEE